MGEFAKRQRVLELSLLEVHMKSDDIMNLLF